MKKYSQERKESILKKLLPPLNQSVAETAREENISVQTLYSWRDKARKQGVFMLSKSKKAKQWSPESKLSIVAETMPMNETQLAEYCRGKGLYPDEIKRWKQELLQGVSHSESVDREVLQKTKELREEKKKLEREIRRKDKALAETTALLVLEKKLGALLDNDEEEH